MIHILVNVGQLPVTGQTLPMISSGGSSVLAVSAAFGMMLSVSRALQDEQLDAPLVAEADKKQLKVK